MSIEDQIEALEHKVSDLIKDEPGVFLVDIRIKPTNNVKIFVDADGGMSIDKLVQYNRRLYKELEESGFFPGGDFSLEISSPGLDEPLKLHRQYVKNTGRYIEVIRKDGVRIEGKLTGVSETEIMVEEEKGKNPNGRPGGRKVEIVQHNILFSDIKTTKIQIKF